MNPDTPENRVYIQKNRLWLLGEVIVMRLLTEKPANIYVTILDVLEKEKVKQTEVVDSPNSDVAAESKVFIQENRVAIVIEEWLKSCLDVKPENPLEYSLSYFGKLGGKQPETAEGRQSPPPTAAS